MSLLKELKNRSDVCEICSASRNLSEFKIAGGNDDTDGHILVCEICSDELTKNDGFDKNHLRCLSDSMWSTTPVVQVAIYRMFKKLGEIDLLEQMYLEGDVKKWAELENSSDSDTVFKDAFGEILNAGDTVTIIKDLDVKGAGFVAKRGTAVRNISLTNDPEHIEGRVNGVKIYLKTCFLKKS